MYKLIVLSFISRAMLFDLLFFSFQDFFSSLSQTAFLASSILTLICFSLLIRTHFSLFYPYLLPFFHQHLRLSFFFLQAPGENFKENNPFEDLPNRVLHPWPAMQQFQFHVRWLYHDIHYGPFMKTMITMFDHLSSYFPQFIVLSCPVLSHLIPQCTFLFHSIVVFSNISCEYWFFYS